ncbi:hypothetical protein [Alteribacillus sp. HJP-4]|uniref:hypothetical protein n=1 Tax=Alteribacillus sp. HJP-4 TaxID=2775394 RepID=UPI0035CD1660
MQLAYYQREEWKYHRYSRENVRYFEYEQKRLHAIERMVYHLNSLYMIEEEDRCAFTNEENEILQRSVQSITSILRSSSLLIPTPHYTLISELDNHFWHIQEHHPEAVPRKYHHHFPKEVIVFYVVLSIHDTLEELALLSDHYHRSG